MRVEILFGFVFEHPRVSVCLSGLSYLFNLSAFGLNCGMQALSYGTWDLVS